MILTAAQMQALEKAQIDSGAVESLALMERAGQAVLEAMLAHWPQHQTTPARAAVFCGFGNNGGDGFVIARLLRARGWEITTYLLGDPSGLRGDARINYQRFAEVGKVTTIAADVDFHDAEAVDYVVDALLGTGLSRPLQQNPIAAFVAAQAEGRRPGIVAVDLPSGLSADTGHVVGGDLGSVVPADLTVTFAFAKLGHFLGDGPRYCGQLAVKSIGLQEVDTSSEYCRLVMPEGSAWRGRLGKVSHGAHKFSHGHAVILSGGPGKTGAARLAARGALRAGAGLVSLGVPPSAQLEVAAQVTAIMLTRVADATALAEVLRDDRINALAMGPGLGTGERELALVAKALRAGRALVLDADALTLLSRDDTLFAALHGKCILTPHGGEFARLFPDLSAKLAPEGRLSKVEATRTAARRAGCVVVFKGADTVIAAPDGRCLVHAAAYARSAPWLATAGAGDVLAGIMAGLLAQGMAPLMAAEAAVWLHVEAALAFGPGLIAEDLPEQLPRVFQRLAL
jgi:ADP-dependent NAD(P)H-hydrate dehydratase / NAD(P)H-hydrate epimerase